MKHVLVTGGAGYIGSHTAKALSLAGYRPVIVDNFSTGNRWAVKWGDLVEANIADYAVVRRVIEKYRVVAAIHFAASAYVGESIRAPKEYFGNNVSNSLEFLNAVVDTGLKSVVFSSTCSTYGNPLTPLIAEDHPKAPLSPYGESKLFVERALNWYESAYGVHSVCLRYFNAAGADVEGEIGECHEPETHLIPLTIAAALGRREGLEVYGTDYPTADGSAVRDYVHVSDLAQAHLLALQYLLDGGPSIAMNLGTGRGHSVLEIVEAVSRLAAKPIRRRLLARRAGDAASLIAQAELVHKILGWKPKYPEIDTIIETAWRWYSGDSPC